jgi:aminoglycoside/choline kinase family phosphotransferase
MADENTTQLVSRAVANALGLDGSWSATSIAIGNGQVAECRRWEFTGPNGEKRTIISKSPSLNETSRETARAQNLYLRETSFYRELLAHLAIRTPRVEHVHHHVDTDDFLLLLEDLTPSAQVDQFTGLGIQQARSALSQLAGLHGPTAGREDLFGLDWLGGVATSLRPMYEMVLPLLFDQFLERYRSDLDEQTLSTVSHLRSCLGQFSSHTATLRCVVHGDFRSENMIFDGSAGQVPLAIVDWQTVTVASPMLDVAYFLITSLSRDDCETHEDELIDFYLGELAAHGAVLSASDAREEFARNCLQPIVMLVAASVIVQRTERGDQMFLTMIRRAVDAVTRWDAFSKVA